MLVIFRSIKIASSLGGRLCKWLRYESEHRLVDPLMPNIYMLMVECSGMALVLA